MQELEQLQINERTNEQSYRQTKIQKMDFRERMEGRRLKGRSNKRGKNPKGNEERMVGIIVKVAVIVAS